MAKLTVISTKNYTSTVFPATINVIDFASSDNFTTATFSGVMFDGLQISQTVQLNGKLQGYSDILVNITGNFDASDWTFKNWDGTAGINLIGGNSNDVISGTIKGDFIWGGLGTNVISGGNGSDGIWGYDFHNHGKDGIDTLNGGAGDDGFFTLGGNDHIDGGDGIDILNVTANGGAYVIDINTALISFGVNSTAINVERIAFYGSYAGADNDSITGGELDDTLWGGRGNDTLIGGGGDDEIQGDDGDDIIRGGAGNDLIDSDTDEGSDSIDGGAGQDYLRINGYQFSTDPTAFHIDIRSGGQGADIGNGTTIAKIEQIFFSGDLGDDVGYGGNLNDGFFGGGGADRFSGGGGKDFLSGGDGDDQLSGGTGSDQLLGEAGDDILTGGAGADFVRGDEGIDTANYSASTLGVRLTLGFSDEAHGGDAEGDRLYDIENLTGSAFIDFLTGDQWSNTLAGMNGNDRLSGLDGNDFLKGGVGNDFLGGGTGQDVMKGGAGIDRFIYASSEESAPDDSRDLIMDFVLGVDKIDLAAIDADLNIFNGNTAFNFIGTGEFGAAGDLRFVSDPTLTIIEADLNGDGLADFSIGLTGPILLTNADFIL